MQARNTYGELTKLNKSSYNRKKVRKIQKKRIYYLVITIVLFVCLFQAVRGAYINIAKFVVLNKQLHKLKSLSNGEVEKNNQLKTELKNYTSKRGIEALARDNLKMVGKDEVLVLIKEPQKLQ